MTSDNDYYKILGVSKDSSKQDIKNSYRRLASKHHPDKGGDEATFKKIQEAYDTLGDDDKRAQYDGGGMNHGGGFYREHNFNHSDFSDFADVFEAMRRQSAAQRRRRVSISLEEAYIGATIHTDAGAVKIPKGIRSGTNVSLPSKEIITIVVRDHPKFIRDLDNLVLTVSISSLEAITGIDMNIKLLDGSTVKTKIPSGIQYSQSIRLAGKGMPNPQTGGYGDLYVNVLFDTPTNLTNDQKTVILGLLNRTSISV